MNLDSFKMFCLVVENGSISEAARKFFVSQPAVTRQIQALEEYYDVLLFERTGGKLKITEAGKLLYPYMKAILEDHERAKEALSNFKGKYQAQVCVGATLTIGEYLLPRLLERFKREVTDLNLTIRVANTQEILESLAEHTIDLALIEGKVNDDSLIVEKFADDELILICPVEHEWADKEEITIDELTKERMIWREVGSGTRMIVENALEKEGVLDRIVTSMEIGSTQAIKGAVEAGLGVAFLSKMTVIRELELNLVKEVKVKDFEIKRELWLALAPQRFRRQGVDRLLEFFRTHNGL
ncbi:MAG: LysR family transcriptional regulator [Bacillaceae bacterium]|nr:LysR family transcriptional regulator [Bacillaceae bacterium]